VITIGVFLMAIGGGIALARRQRRYAVLEGLAFGAAVLGSYFVTLELLGPGWTTLVFLGLFVAAAAWGRKSNVSL
jgi:hypothetical protein